MIFRIVFAVWRNSSRLIYLFLAISFHFILNNLFHLRLPCQCGVTIQSFQKCLNLRTLKSIFAAFKSDFKILKKKSCNSIREKCKFLIVLFRVVWIRRKSNNIWGYQKQFKCNTCHGIYYDAYYLFEMLNLFSFLSQQFIMVNTIILSFHHVRNHCLQQRSKHKRKKLDWNVQKYLYRSKRY